MSKETEQGQRQAAGTERGPFLSECHDCGRPGAQVRYAPDDTREEWHYLLCGECYRNALNEYHASDGVSQEWAVNREDAEALASLINGDWGFEWDAEVQPDIAGFCVVATFEEGGVHRLRSRSEWNDVRALVYGESDDDDEEEDGDE